MRILKKVLLVVVGLVVLLAVIGLILPRQIHVERQTTIDAPQATVFAVLNGFRSFNRWSPWYELDPEARYTYEGPDTGVGAKMSWASDKAGIGSGSQEIIESREHERVRALLDFGAQGTAISTFSLSMVEEGVRTIWSLDTDLGFNPLSRYFGLLLDSMIGKDYEKGLAGLKKFAESLPKADIAGLQVEAVEVSPVTVAYVSTSSTMEPDAIASAIGGAYAQVGRFMKSHKLSQSGAPQTINTKWDEGAYEFDAAIPIDRPPDKDVPSDSPVKVRQTYGGKTLKVVHRGAYQGLGETYEKIYAYIHAHGYETAGSSWDEYVTDPGNTPEAELITHIFVPVKG